MRPTVRAPRRTAAAASGAGTGPDRARPRGSPHPDGSRSAPIDRGRTRPCRRRQGCSSRPLPTCTSPPPPDTAPGTAAGCPGPRPVHVPAAHSPALRRRAARAPRPRSSGSPTRPAERGIAAAEVTARPRMTARIHRPRQGSAVSSRATTALPQWALGQASRQGSASTLERQSASRPHACEEPGAPRFAVTAGRARFGPRWSMRRPATQKVAIQCPRGPARHDLLALLRDRRRGMWPCGRCDQCGHGDRRDRE
jgi:hypothetical protein